MLQNETVSCRIIRSCLDYSSAKGIDLDEIISRHDYSFELLEDSYNWVTVEFFNDIILKIEKETSKHPIAVEIGSDSTSRNSWGDIENVIKAIGNTKPILVHFDKFLGYFLKYPALARTASDESSITIKEGSGGELYKNACEFITGAIISLPRLWGGDDLSAVRMRDGSIRVNFNEDPCFFDTSSDYKKFSPKLLEEIIHGLEKTKKTIDKKNIELEKKNQELEKAYKNLEKSVEEKIQSEKMATIGSLSIGIAHEINNPLSFIISNFKTLKKYIDQLKESANTGKTPNDEMLRDIPKLIDETEEGLFRVKKIVEDINYIAHPGDKSKTQSDVTDIIKNALRITRSMYKDSIIIVEKYEHKNTLICSPSRISQVLLNIIMNAIQAIKTKNVKQNEGVVTIKTYEKDDQLFIEVNDNGIGIKKENMLRLMEPFFTTKKAGEGTGLGLSTAKSIITAHNGKIEVNSKEGEGTTVTVSVPLKETVDTVTDSGLF